MMMAKVLVLLLGSAWGMVFQSPLGAVSVSDKMGFVVLLATEKKRDDKTKVQRMCPVSLSKRDTERLVSAEGHTIMQLLQEIDAATALLPPDALEKEFREEGDKKLSLDSVIVRKRRTLSTNTIIRDARRKEESMRTKCDLASAAARAPALIKALNSLGLPVSESEAIRLLRLYSTQGELTRQEFGRVVSDLRDEETVTDKIIETSLVSNGREVEATSAFFAFALALRHRAPLTVDENLFDLDIAFDAQDARDFFPLLQEIDALKIQGLTLAAHSSQLFSQANKNFVAALASKDNGKDTMSIFQTATTPEKSSSDDDSADIGISAASSSAEEDAAAAPTNNNETAEEAPSIHSQAEEEAEEEAAEEKTEPTPAFQPRNFFYWP